jgi:hypothetical protein
MSQYANELHGYKGGSAMQVLVCHLNTIDQEGQQAHPGTRLQPVKHNVQNHPSESQQLQKSNVPRPSGSGGGWVGGSASLLCDGNAIIVLLSIRSNLFFLVVKVRAADQGLTETFFIC